MNEPTCSDPACAIPAVVMVRDKPWCLRDGRNESGGRL